LKGGIYSLVTMGRASYTNGNVIGNPKYLPRLREFQAVQLIIIRRHQ